MPYHAYRMTSSQSRGSLRAGDYPSHTLCCHALCTTPGRRPSIHSQITTDYAIVIWGGRLAPSAVAVRRAFIPLSEMQKRSVCLKLNDGVTLAKIYSLIPMGKKGMFRRVLVDDLWTDWLEWMVDGPFHISPGYRVCHLPGARRSYRPKISITDNSGRSSAMGLDPSPPRRGITPLYSRLGYNAPAR